MLTNTFIHIQGIGAITEQRLWGSGLRDWDSFLKDLPIPISVGRRYFLEKGIEESKGYRRFLRGFTMGRISTNRRPEGT